MNGKVLHTPPVLFSRPELISMEEAARVHELARRILHEIGLEVRQDEVRERLQTLGFRARGLRVLIEPAVVEEHVEEMRQRLRARQAEQPSDTVRITLSVSSYSLNLHDVESDQIVPYTSNRLIEMCKFVDSLADEGVTSAPPGIPTDVHPDLRPIAQYRIAALYARQGAAPVDPTSAATVNYLLDMAEVMGRPIRSLPVYIPSPLRLGGESLDVVLSCLDRLSHIHVSSMPSTGATAPLQPFGGLALAAAELMGGMVVLRALTQKPVTFGVGLFPFDLHTGAMVFGSPENMFLQMLCADFNRFYGWPPGRVPDNIHVMAKLPDAQAAAEKAAIMALGAHLGTRHFSGAGTLSLDEIFSPEQLLVDCEIRDWVEVAVRGLPPGEEAVGDGQLEAWLAEVKAGIERSFMTLDSTLDYHQRYIWYPRRFLRNAAGAWFAAGQPRLSERLRNEVRRRIASHSFELDAERRREIERIYQMAERRVLG